MNTTATAQTQRIAVDSETYTYRELGPEGGVPLVCLPHFTAVMDYWDPRTIDAIDATRRVILFDNRGVGGSTGSVPRSVDAMGLTPGGLPLPPRSSGPEVPGGEKADGRRRLPYPRR